MKLQKRRPEKSRWKYYGSILLLVSVLYHFITSQQSIRTLTVSGDDAGWLSSITDSPVVEVSYVSSQSSPSNWPPAQRTNGTAILTTPGPWPSQKDICDQWITAERDNKVPIVQVSTKDERSCTKFAVGNKLLSIYSARAIAHNMNVQFEIYPPCPKESAGLVALLPQSIQMTLPMERSEEEIREQHEKFCKNAAHPVPHTRDDESWIKYSPVWAKEIRSALQTWATENNKPPIQDHTVAIHFRCGDILTSNKGQYGFQPLSFYVKHLKDKRRVKYIDVLTPSLSCKDDKSNNTRNVDCWNGKQCGEILYPLIHKLADAINLPYDRIRIRDQESVLWTMHHLAFADITFCGFSSFCLLTGMANKHSVHAIYPTSANSTSDLSPLAESMTHLPKYINGFVVERDIEYLDRTTMIEHQMNFVDILNYLLTH